MNFISDNIKNSLPKYKQIVIDIEEKVSDGSLTKGDKLPSLNHLKKAYSVSRDTVLMAFNELKNRGVIHSVVGKGYYMLNDNIAVSKKVFLLFDELNSFKEDLYNAFLTSLDDETQVDIYFHHFNIEVFAKLISDNIGNYTHYVIMPANLEHTEAFIKHLPKDKVYILDQIHAELSPYSSIYQNFKKDIYDGLQKAILDLKKYSKIILQYAEDKQPKGILEGFVSFCKQHQFAYEIIESFQNRTLCENEIYLILDDKNLIRIIKKIKEQNLTIAKDVGVISFNDSLLKEVVEGGITTISTDFKLMGERLAKMILADEFVQIENPSNLILRNSI